MNTKAFTSKRVYGLASLTAVLAVILPGCVATRNWVRQEIEPMAARVSAGENRLGQAEGRISQAEGKISEAEGKISGVEGQLGQVDAKTEKALSALANLRLERKLVLDLKEGANFAFDSAALPEDARREINGFLADLIVDDRKGSAAGMDGTVFLIAGHTDATGSEEYNYELGKRRAESVARYLITQKKMNPVRVIAVSYGKTAPLADNRTRDGRAKNRRVEVLAYREGIVSAEAPAQAEARGSSRPEERVSRR